MSHRTRLIIVLAGITLFLAAVPRASEAVHLILTTPAAVGGSDLVVTKTGPDTAAAGSDISFNITVSNLGPDVAPRVTLRDSFTPTPLGALSFVSVTQDSGPVFTCNPTPTGNISDVCTTDNFPVGASSTFTVVLHVASDAPPGAYTNIARVIVTPIPPNPPPGDEDPPLEVNDENNTSSATFIVPGATSADLQAAKSGPANAAPDSDVPFTITITNAGPDAAANVSFSDTLPGDMTYVSIVQNSGPTFSCTTGPTPPVVTVTCTLASMTSGATAAFTLKGHIPPGTPSGAQYDNQVTVSSIPPNATADPIPENNTGFTSVKVSSADVSITKTGPPTAFAGSPITWTLTLANGALSDTAIDATFTDLLPSGTTFVSLIHVAGTAPLGCTTPSQGQNGTVSCIVSALDPGGTSQYTLTANISTLVPTGTVIKNTATSSSDNFDPDNNNNSSTAETSVTNTIVNQPPDAVDDSLSSVAEDSGVRTMSIASLLANDSAGPLSDTGQTITLTAVGSPVGGTVTFDATNVYFTPAADFNGPASFQYTITDNGTTNGSPDPKSDTATVSFTITEVNDAPTVTNDSLSNVAEDSGQRTISIASLTANDSKGPANEGIQTLTLALVAGSAVGGSVTSDAINVYFTPTADYNGPASFQYTVTDNGTTNGAADPKASGQATVSFTITEVNDAPTAVGDTITNSAEDSGARTILASTLTGNDSKGPANESGQTLIIKTVSNPVGGTVSIVSGNVVFTPTADYNGPASFQYTVEDNGTTNGSADPRTSGSATVNFNITEVNDATDAVNDALSSVAEDSGVRTIPIASLLANDTRGPANESGQTLTLTGVSNPVGGTVTSDATNVYFTPAADFNGAAGFQYTVTDNGTTNGSPDPKSDTATVSFTVTEVNDTTDAVNDALSSVAEDSGMRTIPIASLLANDTRGPANESGQTLTLTGVSNPVGGTVTRDATNVYFTPAADYNGPASFQYTVTDNGTTNGSPDPKSDTATVSFTTTEVNDAPVAEDDPLGNMAEDAPQRTIAFSVLTGDDSKGSANESGQSLIVKTVSDPIGITVSIVAGTVRFTPLPNYHGPASFRYTVEDNGTTNGVADPKTSATSALAHFNITAVADTPSVTNATTNANTQTTSGLVISRNPADGAEVTHFKITGITNGSLFKNDGTTPINNGDFITFAEGNAGLKFTPGTVNGSFTVQASLSASDAGLSSLSGGTAVATIIINPLGGVIRFSSATYSVAEGAGFRTITVERTGDTSRAVTVDYVSSDHSTPADFIPCNSPGAGFASSRCDFTTAIGTLKFAAGETTKTFNVLINQDNYVEGTETLSLTLSNPSGGAVFGVPQTATLEILDDVSEPATNPIDNAADFVKQQYRDILHREADGPGLAFWTDNIEKCNDPARRPAGQTVAQCIDKQRESTAIAFFMSPEFHMTGGYVFHLYKGSLTGPPNYDGGSPGRFPTFLEFMHDVNQVSEGIVVGNQISGAVVEANRNALATEFVQRPEFIAKYGGLNNTLYVQELFNTTGITPTAAEKQALVDGLNNSTETRASVLRKVVDGTVVISEANVQFTTTYGQAFYNQEYRRLFVYLEYVGYLRRNPDAAGFVFWLGKLNSFNGDPFLAEMVRSFIMSPEYRSRFGQP